jgi:predicted MFS family arabinose efflux permease
MPSPGIKAAAASASAHPGRLLGALAWLLDLGLIAALIAAHNAGEVAEAIALAGWSIGLVGLAHLGALLADTLGWRALLPPARRPALRAMMANRWIGNP